jgi:dihydroneopterin aldolase/2-amino-4-hydroxy-6-hydroxymethyldihydropteridine diphosphokinase
VTDNIELRGLRALGRHGALAEERDRAQPFEVDLDIEVDLRPAGRSDALGDTVDYGTIAESVYRVVTGEHSELLEHLAERIARAVVEAGGPTPAVEAVTVSVRKLRPPVPVDMASAGVRIRRSRRELV